MANPIICIPIALYKPVVACKYPGLGMSSYDGLEIHHAKLLRKLQSYLGRAVYYKPLLSQNMAKTGQNNPFYPQNRANSWVFKGKTP
jgi:hypothetical protein